MKKYYLISDNINKIKEILKENYPYYKVIEFNNLIQEFFNVNELFNKENKEDLTKLKIYVEEDEIKINKKYYTEEVVRRMKFDFNNFFKFISKDIKLKIENLIKDYDIILFNVDEIKEMKDLENKFKNVFDIKTVKLIFSQENKEKEEIKFLITDYNIEIKNSDNQNKKSLISSIKNYIPDLISLNNQKLVQPIDKNDINIEYIKFYEEMRFSIKNNKIFKDIIEDKINEIINYFNNNQLDWFTEIGIFSIVFNKILELKKINSNDKTFDILIREFNLKDYKTLFIYKFDLYKIDYAIEKFVKLNKNEVEKIQIVISNHNYNYEEIKKIIYENELLDYKHIYYIIENFFNRKYIKLDNRFEILQKIYELIK